MTFKIHVYKCTVQQNIFPYQLNFYNENVLCIANTICYLVKNRRLFIFNSCDSIKFHNLKINIMYIDKQVFI